MDPRMLLQILPDEDGLARKRFSEDQRGFFLDTFNGIVRSDGGKTIIRLSEQERQMALFNLRRHGAPEKQFKEAALSASDFPLLLADVLDRQVMAKYEVEPNPFEPLGRKRMIGDLTRYVKTFAYIGELEMLEIVAPEGPYTQARPMSEGVNQYRLDKWGKRFNLQWEMFLADDVGLMDRYPGRLADSARVTRIYQFLNQLMTTTGWRNYSKQGSVPTTAFSATNLAAAVAAMKVGDYAENQSIRIRNTPRYLVYAEELRQTVFETLYSEAVVWSNPAGTTDVAAARRGDKNYIRSLGLIPISFDGWNRMIVTAGTNATMWGLFSEEIPVVEEGFLRSAPEPEIWTQLPNAIRAGGGAVGPMEGSYEADVISHRVRFPYAAQFIADNRTTLTGDGTSRGLWVSNGA